MNNSSEIVGQGIQSLLPGKFVTIEGKSRLRERSQFVVSNLAAAGGDIIYVCGSDDKEALPIFPQQSILLETDSPFRLKSPVGNNGTTYIVGEIYSVSATPIRTLQRGAGTAPAGTDTSMVHYAH